MYLAAVAQTRAQICPGRHPFAVQVPMAQIFPDRHPSAVRVMMAQISSGRHPFPNLQMRDGWIAFAAALPGTLLLLQALGNPAAGLQHSVL